MRNEENRVGGEECGGVICGAVDRIATIRAVDTEGISCMRGSGMLKRTHNLEKGKGKKMLSTKCVRVNARDNACSTCDRWVPEKPEARSNP